MSTFARQLSTAATALASDVELLADPAALRERLHALEVSRLEMVKALGQDAPPVKLSFYAPPGESAPRSPAAMARLADLLQPCLMLTERLAEQLADDLPALARRLLPD
jgi:hypothetical protein